MRAARSRWLGCLRLRGGVMARPASVFVRDLTGKEGLKLRRLSRQSKVFALRQRAQIVLASNAGSAASEIALVLQTDENQVRRVIRDFNADGKGSLLPQSRRASRSPAFGSGNVRCGVRVPVRAIQAARVERSESCGPPWRRLPGMSRRPGRPGPPAPTAAPAPVRPRRPLRAWALRRR